MRKLLNALVRAIEKFTVDNILWWVRVLWLYLLTQSKTAVLEAKLSMPLTLESKIITIILVINTGVLSWYKMFNDPTLPSVGALSTSGLIQAKIKSSYRNANPIMRGSMFTVWLVEDIDVFQGKIFSDDFQPSSDRDRFLNIEIKYEGWMALMFGALGASLESYRDWVAKWRSGETTDMFLVPKYPLLSRLNDNFVDVGFTRSEIKALRQEALSLINEPIDEPARNLLHIIVDICDEAQKQNLAIYLLAP